MLPAGQPFEAQDPATCRGISIEKEITSARRHSPRIIINFVEIAIHKNSKVHVQCIALGVSFNMELVRQRCDVTLQVYCPSSALERSMDGNRKSQITLGDHERAKRSCGPE